MVLKSLLLSLAVIASLLSVSLSKAQESPRKPGKVYITLWFDTEDYILPQSDDAAKRVAEMLTQLGVRATFKVVGEKARTLERRKRTDVIAALKKHEIGYHSDNHSQHPTPAEYEEPLDWDTGVREFTRREKPGFEDVKRIFGQMPSCYGQPGSSWAPQSYASLRSWGVKVYLDESSQVGLDGKPFWYGGILNIFNTREGGQLRARDNWNNLPDARQKFEGYYKKMTGEGGGIISIFFHPCEFVHEEFWDGVNFAKGANPPREEWKLPRMATPAEQERRYRFLSDLVTFLKSYPEVRFVTASEALRLYSDRADEHIFEKEEIARIASIVGADISFQTRAEYNLSPAEVLVLLNSFVADPNKKSYHLNGAVDGPSSGARSVKRDDGPLQVPWSQFSRTVQDVQRYLDAHKRVPNEVWLGSRPVSPESYLAALAEVAGGLEKGVHPASVKVPMARLATAQYVADESPKHWGWVIFPEGFRAPNLMALAKLQAWTIKPAVLHEP